MIDPAQSNSTPSSAKQYDSLLDALVAKNKLSKQMADSVALEQINTGQELEELLTQKNIVSEVDITEAKAEFFHLPFVSIPAIGISPEALTKIPESVARLYRMFPFQFDKDQNLLHVAMENPLDLNAVDFAEKKSGCRLKAYFASPSELNRAISEKYAQTLSSEVTEALKETKQVASDRQQKQDLSKLSGQVIRDAPITKIVETFLSFAMKSRASDIHIEPLEDRTRVRYRIDGILYEKLVLPKSVHDAVVSRIKILSQLKIDEKRLPQDGRFTFLSSGEEVDLRVSTLPTVYGEKVVLRLLKKNAVIPTLSDLGMRGNALKNFQVATRVPHGIILVTGPTGSGKTTTLYSVLHEINTPKVNILTLEDPVEYQIQGVNQVQINPQAGLTFASGLRSFLRQDPNIIMVGEIRDPETAELAIQASLTGHLVFSTLHTNSAASSLPRLLDMGAEPFLLASSMTLLMAQRVVRKLNEAYKEEYIPTPEVIADMKEVLGSYFTAWCAQHKKKENEITLFRSSQNRPETEGEYKGRVGIFEVMPMTEKIGKLILEHQPASALEHQAVADGMMLMKQDGYLKALEGITTLEEVLRVAET